MTNNTKNKKTKEKMSKNKILLIIICIFVALVIVFGATFGIIIAVRNARTYISYASVRIDEGEARFLLAYYKLVFMTRYGISKETKDNAEFWASEYKDGMTYAEILTSEVKTYIEDLAVKNYLFDRFSEMSFEDSLKVRETVREVLLYRADGSEDKFNDTYASLGFDYDDFVSSAELIYKANVVFERIYGSDGQNVKTMTDICNSFYAENYSEVKLLFIRTENDYVYEDGKRVTDENGNDVLEELSESEKQKRAALIEEIRTLIKAYEDKSGEVRMTPEEFTNYISKHGDGGENKTAGFYFSALGSAFTDEFRTNEDGSVNEQRNAIVDSAISMNALSYKELTYSGGVCFVYKYSDSSSSMPYNDTSADGCFSDFYRLVAQDNYSDTISELRADVVTKDRFSKIEIASLPIKNMFIPSF